MKSIHSRAALFVSALLLAPMAVQAAPPTKAEYDAAKNTISANYKAAKDACDSLKANAKDICEEEAKAAEKNARAELEFRASGKPADGARVQIVKADGIYEVAKERCDDLSGNAKDVCNKEAKAAHVAAIAAAKSPNASAESRAEAKEDVNEARYKAAAEKCDTLTGDAKTACVQAAKTAHGQR
ncbi:MAG: hypothetical protein Q8M80_08310 [Hydrogenophaga sp.]|uniref:hypothetical protein n=1 Tax=Hydrogenophaga sp. TaxID=1904254 RepID=UPI0027356983|nr:hypothetical protein [Hydrogenophaga sp.]MDP3204058.1 hypothetical protein [Hydrogenophaga sp.]MDP3626149.1 hypothetical protein [Hydrogenophaga sp.]